MGLFGSDDKYFFYMKFTPYSNVSATAGWFRMWFQIGNTSSPWHGVYYQNVAGTALTDDVQLNEVSATNTVFTSNQSEEFDDDSSFQGVMDRDGVVTIWHEVLKREQTTDDQSIIRIEKKRELLCKYDKDGDPATAESFTVILEESYYAISPMMVLGAAVTWSLM